MSWLQPSWPHSQRKAIASTTASVRMASLTRRRRTWLIATRRLVRSSLIMRGRSKANGHRVARHQAALLRASQEVACLGQLHVGFQRRRGGSRWGLPAGGPSRRAGDAVRALGDVGALGALLGHRVVLVKLDDV